MGSHSGRERILSKEVRSFMAEFLPLTRLIALSVGRMGVFITFSLKTMFNKIFPFAVCFNSHI